MMPAQVVAGGVAMGASPVAKTPHLGGQLLAGHRVDVLVRDVLGLAVLIHGAGLLRRIFI